MYSLSLGVAARLIADGSIGAEEYARHLLDRADAMSHLNALISLDREQVLEAARLADIHRLRGAPLGPLHGVPLVLKDNINTRRLPTTAGTPALRDHRPFADAPVAARLFAAGGLLFGKAGLHELSYGGTTINAALGSVRNPYDPQRIAGGSSGGVAASVAAGMVPAGIGSDTGGSIRIPAALCGLAGFRPSVDRWPTEGIVPISPTRDVSGPIARGVEDLALLDAVVSGSAPSQDRAPETLNGVRLGVPLSFFWEDLDPAIERLCKDALERLADAGACIEEVDFPDMALEIAAMSAAISLFETPACLSAYLRDFCPQTSLAELCAAIASPDVRKVFAVMLSPAEGISRETYRFHMERTRPRLREAYRQILEDQGLDALVFPMTPLAAPPLSDIFDTLHNGRTVSVFHTVLRNADPGSCAGQPGLTLPVGRTADGLPVGIGLDGGVGADRRLLRVGEAIEACLGPAAGTR